MCNYQTIILSLLLVISCNGHEKKEDNTSYKQNVINEKTKSNMNEEVITKEKLKKTTLVEVSKKFSNPITQRNFMFGEDTSEFTISLRNHFTKKELLSKSIPIKEITWRLDKDNNITVWYRSDKPEKPIDVYVWNKDAEF